MCRPWLCLRLRFRSPVPRAASIRPTTNQSPALANQHGALLMEIFDKEFCCCSPPASSSSSSSSSNPRSHEVGSRPRPRVEASFPVHWGCGWSREHQGRGQVPAAALHDLLPLVLHSRPSRRFGHHPRQVKGREDGPDPVEDDKGPHTIESCPDARECSSNRVDQQRRDSVARKQACLGPCEGNEQEYHADTADDCACIVWIIHRLQTILPSVA